MDGEGRKRAEGLQIVQLTVSLHSFRGGNPNRRNIGRVLDRRRWGWLWSIGRLAVGSGGDWVGIGAWTVYLMLA